MAERYSFAVEQLTPELQHEMTSMLHDYYEATPAKDGIPPYDLDWALYEVLQDQGTLLVTTVRSSDTNAFIGCALYHVIGMLHHKGFMVAECDGISIDHRYRGKGLGKALYEFTEPYLLERGAKRIINRYRLIYNTTPMFPSLGFEAEEMVYVKRVS